ncbi:MAG: adenylate/guanylate cyclase domain-containing protein [Pseudomonadota bacterium]
MRVADWLFGSGRALGFVLLAALIALRIADPPFLENTRNRAFDLFQQFKPRDAAPAPVAIIDIDDKSISELGQWPWPRTRLADLVSRTAEAGAAALAFDIIFSEPDRLSPDLVAQDNEDLPELVREELAALPGNDQVLAAEIAVFPVVVGQTSVRIGAAEAPGALPPEVAHGLIGPDPRPFLLTFPDLVENLPELEAAAAGRGVFSVRPDPDGVYRRVPMVVVVEDRIRLGLAPELLRVATGGAPFAIRTNDAGVEGVVVARQLVQTDADGTVWPYLAPSDANRFVSATDLLGGRVLPDRLDGHLVLVGTSAIGLEDFRATPLGVAMAGVEIHAQVLENILTGSLLVRPNYTIAAELTVVFVLGLLAVLLLPAMGALWVVASALVLLAGYASATWFLFSGQRVLLDPTYPLFATALLVMTMATANYIREERRREQIRGAFGQYVSPDLVARLADSPEDLRLGGETRELTLLFTDVRGFTTISEDFKDNPPGLTALMNRFLTTLSQAILAEGGTIDKFMGDAVMAFWNAPVDVADHAEAACRAALDMQAGVSALNAQRAAEAKEDPAIGTPHVITVGIGINTGTCVVGNMGSDTRFDYTALGDSVNLASRLEGASSLYDVGIALGASTADRVKDSFAILELDLIRVKGKTQPECVFALVGDAALAASGAFVALRSEIQTMLAAYREQDWTGARTALAAARAQAAAADVPLSGYLDLFRDRIEDLASDPPGADWQGVFIATSK